MGRFFRKWQTPDPPLASAAAPELFSIFGVHGNGATGPASSIVTGNNDVFNTALTLTQWAWWLNGYYWWRADSGQPSGAQKFCLWQETSEDVGTLISGSVVTSSQAFTAGAWNFVPLATPIGLTSGIIYRVATGLTGNFPFTSGYFGTGGPGAGGIVSGPISCYSDIAADGGTFPNPTNANQCTFSSAVGNDPTVGLVGNASSSFNAWQDLQVGNGPPAGATFRLWPSLPFPPTQALDTATNFMLGTEFSLSRAASLKNIWFYSPATVTQLPTECGIWSVGSQTLVPGTDNPAPAWSGI